MSNSLKVLSALALLVVVSACADQNADPMPIVIEQPVVSMEPVYTGKYK